MVSLLPSPLPENLSMFSDDSPALGWLQSKKETDPEFVFEPTIGSMPTTWTQYQYRTLCHGLDFLYGVAIAPKHDFLSLVKLQAPDPPSPEDGQSSQTWSIDALEKCLNPEPTGNEQEDSRGLVTLSREEYNEVFRPSLATYDQDHGPFDGWWWAYKTLPRLSACYDPRMVNVRRMGIMFWDARRIASVGFIQRLEVWVWRWALERESDWTRNIIAYEPRGGAYWVLGDEGVVPDRIANEHRDAKLVRG